MENADLMTCPSPPGDLLPQQDPLRRRRRQTAQYHVGFLMDGVEEVQNLQRYLPNVTSTFDIYPDPVIFPFEDGQKVYKGEALILEVS